MTPLPHNEAVEKHVLSACLKDDGATYRRAIDAGIDEHSFHDPRHVLIWRTFARTPSPSLELLFPLIAPDRVPPAYLLEIDNEAATTAHAGQMIDTLAELSAKRTLIRQATALIERAQNGTSIDELTQSAKDLVPRAAEKDSRSLESRRVKFTVPPQEPTVRLFLANKPICTPGNLTTIISRAKTGKTATLGGAVAAIIASHYDRHNLDTLGFTAPHTNEAVVLIDTEQSPYDAWTCHSRTLSRAQQTTDPAWLCHYALVGYSASRLRQSVPIILDGAKAGHKGIFTLILDGVADFVTSVNDEAECNEFVSWLRGLSITYDCPIICVIHSNEGVKTGDDGRGWLGKELTRKAESNLLLKKVGDVTTITSEKQRKAPITEADGIAFRWSEEHQRHTLCEQTQPSKARGGRQKLHDISDFMECIPAKGQPPKNAAQIHRAAVGIKEVKLSTFKDLLADAVTNGVLVRTYDDRTGFSYARAL